MLQWRRMVSKALSLVWPSRPFLILVSWLLLVLVLTILVTQAYHPSWRSHLQVDVVVFQMRALHFLQQGTWANVGYNEYQPGALWFFAWLAWLTPTPFNFDAYLTVVVLVNLGLILAHGYFFSRYGHRYALLFFAILVGAMGPILFYRFELIVSLLVLIAWRFFQKKNFPLAATLLGLACAIKVYPVILLPLFMAEAVARRQMRNIIWTVEFFALGLVLPVVLFIALGGSLSETLTSVNVHQLKPVGLEGLWGTLITLGQQIAGIPLRITPSYGVHGFTPDLPGLTTGFLNNFWLLPYGVTLAYIYWRGRQRGYSDAGLAFMLILVFVFFSKVLNPQYLWWYISFLPLVPLAWYDRGRWSLIILTACLSLVITQVIYPVRYSEFLDWFNGRGSNPATFYLSILRNVLILILGLFAGDGIWRHYQRTRHQQREVFTPEVT
ncbi:MAG: glycosyltransferase family 87 protein [Candidatus Andersenbacteria bacterium]